mgnify:FL=1
MDWIAALGYIIAPVSSIITWFVGRKKSRNDFLREMQASIDLLATRNGNLIKEVTELRGENMRLRLDVQRLAAENAKMSKEIEGLNSRFKNIKTITKKG